ncbi:MAG: hypothetical protein AAGD38_20820, partial [Acidobacteriota bacterium]
MTLDSRFRFPGLVIALLFSLVMVGCASDPAPETTAEDPAPSTESTAYSTSDSDLQPVRAGGDSTTDGHTIQAPGATFTMPSAWRAEPPANSMRLAQAAIPGEGGDGELTVFYFGAGGGG